MNWLDIVILLSLGASLVGGLVTGFIRGFLAIIGLIAGIIVAGRLYGDLTIHLGFIQHDGAAKAVAFATIFFAIMLITAIITIILRAVITSIMLGWLDKLLGGITGLLVGVLVCGLLLTLWAKFFGGAVLENSYLAPYLVAKIPLVLSLLPAEFDSVKEFFH